MQDALYEQVFRDKYCRKCGLCLDSLVGENKTTFCRDHIYLGEVGNGLCFDLSFELLLHETRRSFASASAGIVSKAELFTFQTIFCDNICGYSSYTFNNCKETDKCYNLFIDQLYMGTVQMETTNKTVYSSSNVYDTDMYDPDNYMYGGAFYGGYVCSKRYKKNKMKHTHVKQVNKTPEPTFFCREVPNEDNNKE